MQAIIGHYDLTFHPPQGWTAKAVRYDDGKRQQIGPVPTERDAVAHVEAFLGRTAPPRPRRSVWQERGSFAGLLTRHLSSG